MEWISDSGEMSPYCMTGGCAYTPCSYDTCSRRSCSFCGLRFGGGQQDCGIRFCIAVG